jgi:hypothetical protein
MGSAFVGVNGPLRDDHGFVALLASARDGELRARELD